MTCSNCGAWIDDVTQPLCDQCGAQLDDGAAQRLPAGSATCCDSIQRCS